MSRCTFGQSSAGRLSSCSRSEVISKTELRTRLTAELEAMDSETRAADCESTVDDLITDSLQSAA